MDAGKSEINRVIFLRITLIGSTGCGKTCLANSFVNNSTPQRYVKTENAVVLHKKVEVVDDGEWEDVRRPIFVEVEDTPGSEQGNNEEGGGVAADNGPPRVRRGARVILNSDKKQVMAMFNDPKYKGRLRYIPAMDGMLGREYPVRSEGRDGSVALPSPDGSEGGAWNFPRAAVKLKTSMDLPVDKFLDLGEKPKITFAELKERKQYTHALQFPLSAYPRPIGKTDMDKTLTKCRMGYFICFDVSDDTGDSLKEAMNVYAMLRKSLERQKSNKLKPIIWLVGCKADRTSQVNAMQMNMSSAKSWSDEEEIPFYVTAARNQVGVTYVYTEMIQAICSRESLWSLDAADDGEEEVEQNGCVFN